MARYTGTRGDDSITGTDNNDTISLNGGGNDTVNAGKGNDYIDLQSYTYYEDPPNPTNATIIFNIGDGQDTISNWWAGPDTGTIVFGEGITQDMLSFEIINGEMVLKIGDNGDQITFSNLLYYDDYFRTLGLQFADGTSITDMTDINPFLHIGTAGDDVIIGSDEADYILGHGGNDTVYAGEGNDTIYLKEGEHVIYGGDGDKNINTLGNASVHVGNGNNYIAVGGVAEIYAGSGDDYISAAGGYINAGDGNNDIYITGDSTIIAGSGNDNVTLHNTENSIVDTGAGDDYIYMYENNVNNISINGGEGNDQITIYGGPPSRSLSSDAFAGREFSATIVGGKGDDTIDVSRVGSYNDAEIDIHFNLGDGQDTILDRESSFQGNIIFGEGITSDMVNVEYLFDEETNDYTLIIKVGDNGDQITLPEYLSQWGGSGSNYSLYFQDGTVISDIKGSIPSPVIYGTDEDDVIYGTALNDTIYARAGNDYIMDNVGVNYIDAGDGDDTIESDRGTVIGGKGNDVIAFNDGQPSRQPSNFEFQYNLGDGQDTIHNYTQNASEKTIVFGEGIIADMINIQYNFDYQSGNYDVVIKVGDDGDQITLSEYLSPWRDGNNEGYALHFADGTVIEDIRDFIQPIEIVGTADDDYIEGSSLNDIVYAGTGNDYIFERYGANYIDAGEGDDTIISGSGTILGGQGNDSISLEMDTYNNSNQTFDFVVQYNLGDGQDSIGYYGYSYDDQTGHGSVIEGDKIIQFGEGITSDMVTITTEGDNVVLLIGDQGDKIVLEYYLSDLEYRDPVQYRFEFADGTVWQTDGVLSQDPVIVIPPVDSLANSAASSLADASINNQTDNLVNALASFAPASAANSLFDDKPLDINTALLAVGA